MSNYLKKANLVVVLILVISLCLPGNVQAAPEARASFGKSSPKNHAENVGPLNVKLTWGSVSNVYQYFYCYYSRDVADIFNKCDMDDRSTWISNGTSTSVQLSTLMPATKYYWQVAAKLKNNDIVWANGSLTAKWTFTTGSSNVATAGILDDTNSKWVYKGAWTASTATGAYKSTFHKTSAIGAYAELTFEGSRFILTYTGRTNGGLIEVRVDGEIVDTIDTSAGATTWKQLYESPLFESGYHILRLKHIEPASTVINIDAIQIFGTPLKTGIYDDTNGNLFYSGTWAANKSEGAFLATVHKTSTNGDYAEFMFKGTRFILTYTGRTSGGLINVIIDGVPVDPALNPIDAYADPTAWQSKWVSPFLDYDNHTVQLVHAGAAGTVIDVDAIQIFGPPVQRGIYDDASTNYWIYTGDWNAGKATQAFRGTYHRTNSGGAAELAFSGSRFILTYTRKSAGGLIDVIVDGNPVGTIDTYNSATKWQSTWLSPLLPSTGTHLLRLEHAGGTVIEIDAIKIIGTPVEAGIYDDSSKYWFYSGTWAATTPSAAFWHTSHRTGTVGDYAEFSFNGSGFTLTFTKGVNRGLINVYVDGALVDTINAQADPAVWRSTMNYAVAAGPHTVTVEHAGPDGTYIDVDAIEILP